MATKKASPAQIAARKLFAARAKAGTLKKARSRKSTKVAVPRKTTRMPNPKGRQQMTREVVMHTHHCDVESKSGGSGAYWTFLGRFSTRELAEQYAHAYAKLNPTFHVRVSAARLS
jgi:hypothetical protein